MPEGVINIFESIQVQEQKGKAGVVLAPLLHEALEQIVQEVTIWQVGQSVMKHHSHQPFIS